ncbi:MAG: choice-of-anchor D domain-containing protein [Myxococcota bacterium]
MARKLGPGLALLLAAIPLSGCEGCLDQGPLAQTYAIPTVSPETLDFGTVDVAQITRSSFTISNTGQWDYEQLTFTLSEATDPAFKLGDLPFEVKPGEDIAVEVTVFPLVANAIEGEVKIRGHIGGGQYQDLTVKLVARAENRGLPDITVDPMVVDFGRIGRGDVKHASLTIRNDGIRDLILDALELETFEGSPFRCGECPSYTRHVMRPNEVVTIRLSFNPQDVQDYQSALRVYAANDPDEPETEVLLTGSGTQAPTCQVDLLDDVSQLQPQTTVRLDGSRSTSSVPGAYIARYEWDLYRPAGSTTVVESQGPNRPSGLQLAVECPDPDDNTQTPCSTRVDVLADIAGSYVLTLVVEDSLGIRSAPCSADFRAIPKEQLHVQLVWDHPTADMDLHFQRGTGPTFQHETDCYFSNRFPVWFGANAEDPRNPRLDVDDQGGFGPENVNVTTPAQGQYRVSVHYWNAKTQGDPSASATVRIYVRGQLMLEQGNFFTSDQEMWHVADIEWPSDPEAQPTINPLGEVVPYSRPF